jgi:hypothetical protein
MPQTIQNFQKRLPTQEEISVRAYAIYLARGNQAGHEVDDWLQAEYELLQLPIHKIAEIDTAKFFSGTSKRTMLKRSAVVALVQVALALATTKLT